MWREPPCINWCYYAQLACPHLATIKVVDFAGHPTFLCRGKHRFKTLYTPIVLDLDIPQQGNEQQRSIDGVSSCKCVHPCDLSRLSTRELEYIRSLGRQQPTTIAYDFFAAEEHCAQRQSRCDKERERTAALSDDFVDFESSSITGSIRGFVEEQANEFYNRLISDRSFDLTTTTLSDRSINANELPVQRKRKKRRLHHDEKSSGSVKSQSLIYLFIVLFAWSI